MRHAIYMKVCELRVDFFSGLAHKLRCEQRMYTSTNLVHFRSAEQERLFD
jgi:hypothetical protein